MDIPDGFIPFDRDAGVRRTRRNLPHWEQAGCTYFVTFRLGDSIPAAKLAQWREHRDAWCAHHPEPWSPTEWHEYQARFLERIERWSDAGWGECILRNPSVRRIVDDAFLYFDGSRYEMQQFVNMPNHSHLLFNLLDSWTLSKVLHSWRSFTSHQINSLLGRTGALWMDERFDHLVRSGAQLNRFRRYIAENPRRARLRPTEYTLWEQER